VMPVTPKTQDQPYLPRNQPYHYAVDKVDPAFLVQRLAKASIRDACHTQNAGSTLSTA